MERQLITKPDTPETKTNDNRLSSLSHVPYFPTRDLLHSEINLSNQPKLYPAKLQTKLEVSHPGDSYEHEADRVAGQIMMMPAPSVSSIEFSNIPVFPDQVRRKCSNSYKQNVGFNSSEPFDDRIQQPQKIAGSQVVQRLIKSRALQAKLRISQPNDIYEQEADSIADQVMRMPDPILQRRCAKCDEDKRNILQTKRSPRQAQLTQEQAVPPIVQDVLRSSGKPLDAATRAYMEPRFGHDFSGVRVHTGVKAAESARALNAKAYTVGRNIVFENGRPAPNTDDGRRLLAHELTHVVQQNNEQTSRLQRAIGDGHDLASPRFAGDPKLEACYDDEARLTKGDQGDSVKAVQKALIDLGYNLGPAGADGIYGNLTWNAVKQFKADQNLGWESMGDVGPGTMGRLDELFPNTVIPVIPGLTCSYLKSVPLLSEVLSGKEILQRGDFGDAVRKVQQVIIKLGYGLPQHGDNGHYGEETELAVNNFQSKMGLNASGIVNSETLAQLDNKCDVQPGQDPCEIESFVGYIGGFFGDWPSFFRGCYTKQLDITFELVLKAGSKKKDCKISQFKNQHTYFDSQTDTTNGRWDPDGPPWWDGNEWHVCEGTWDKIGGRDRAIFSDAPGFEPTNPIWGKECVKEDDFPIYMGGFLGNGYCQFITIAHTKNCEKRLYWGMRISYKNPKDGGASKVYSEPIREG